MHRQLQRHWFANSGLRALLLLAVAVPFRLLAQEPAVDFAGINAALDRAADAMLSHAPSGFALNATVPVRPSAPEPQSRSESKYVRTSRQQGQLATAVIPILARHGLPAGLAAVVAIESGGNPLALSSKGARGLWQLMPQTARRYGLEVSAWRDDRLDVVKSTDAAAQYFADLYAQFGSWPLALAAYNWGEAKLADAILRTHSSDFPPLASSGALPLETRNYVPAVLARWGAGQSNRKPRSVESGTVVYADQLPQQSRLPLSGLATQAGPNELNPFNQPQEENSK